MKYLLLLFTLYDLVRLDSDNDWNYNDQGRDWKMGECEDVRIILSLGKKTKSY